MKFWSLAIMLVLVCSLGLLVGPGMAESRITEVSADASGCGIALNDNGTVWLWGSVSYNDDTGLQPVIMPGVDHVVAITGDFSPVVLKDDGTVWLLRNYPTFENATRLANWPNKTPEIVPGLSDIVAIDGSQDGSDNLIALKKDGTVWTMGSNSFGQRGTAEGLGDNLVQSIAIDNNGTVRFFDINGQPMDGNSSRDDNELSANVNQVTGLADVKEVSMGAAHALAVKNDGTVWAWGYNNMGQMGNGTAYPNSTIKSRQITPEMVTGLNNVVAVSAGTEFSMALKADGTVWTWGRSDFGQLGDGVPGNVELYRATPVQVKGLTNVTAISAGRWYALALRDDGTVLAWGDNRNGLLGDGTMDSKNVPVQVRGLSGIVAISAGDMDCYALDKYGVVWAWGDDSCGQMGDGSHYSYRITAGTVPFTESLAGPEVTPGWMGSSRPSVHVSVPVPEASVEYMAAKDGSIYAFGNSTLTVMDSNGTTKWNLSIPGAWTYRNAYGVIIDPRVKGTMQSYDAATGTTTKSDTYSLVMQRVKTVPIFAAKNGTTYLYVLTDPSDSTYDPLQGLGSLDHPIKAVDKELIAVGPDGQVKWSHDFVDDVAVQDSSHVEAHNGKIYLYHDYNESVFDESGDLLYTIANIADPVSVDESGNAYALPATKTILSSRSTAVDGGYYDYRIPSTLVVKYGPDGTQIWQKDVGQNISQPYFLPAVWNDEIGLPLYKNGKLYVPVENGIIALDTNSEQVWTKTYDDTYRLFYLMPMDSNGNVYIFNQHEYPRYSDSNISIIAIAPDGSESGRIELNPSSTVIASEGMLYTDGRSTDQIMAAANTTAGDLAKVVVSAYDMTTGKPAWSFTTPVGEPRTVTINESNVLSLFPDYFKSGDPAGSIGDDHARVQIIPAGNLTYIYFKAAAWDDPVIYDQSTYTYNSVLYALDKVGDLVWQKPMGSFVTAAVANNSTIYYGTNGGGISIETVGVVAGVAIAGSLLVFFMLGGVTRARSKIDKNDNRNRILSIIAGRPGSTLYEMSKELGMNIGTLRYHLMILGLNHRIVTYNEEGKFVRYFTNSNTYSDDDKMIISLLRRESMGRLLKVVLDSGEITNGELCVKLGLPESGISKYMSELSDKGVVTKTGQGTRMYYSIREMHRDRLAKATALVENSAATVPADT